MGKLTIGVLMAGTSIEREVGFNSGRTVCDHLDTNRYNIIPLFQTHDGILYILPWHFLHRGKTSDFEHRLEREAQQITWETIKHLVDLLYIAQHGRNSEDGRLQGMLEILGIPYVGSKVFASALGMDKAIQKDFLRDAGIEVPRGILIHPSDFATFKNNPHLVLEKLQEQDISLPVIVKPHAEGSSFGVTCVTNIETFPAALEQAAYANPLKPQSVIIEEKIEGMEFSCIVLEDYVKKTMLPLPPTEIVHEKTSAIFTYDQKYMPGRITKFTPARCSQDDIDAIQNACVKTMHTLGFSTIGRIDGFLTPDKRVVITDPNSFCGMSPSSFAFVQAAQIDMSSTGLINHLIETELASHGFPMESYTHTPNTLKQRIRVAVILGGRSNEREISLESGRNVVYKLSPHKYEAIPLFLDEKLELYKLDNRLLVFNSTQEIALHVTPEQKIAWSALPDIADFVFIALHGGEGENGTVQGALETLRMPYNGSSVLASALCMNKYKTNKFLKARGFDVPNSVLVDQQELANISLELLNKHNLRFPLIVKPHDDGCSVFVNKANTISELISACMHMFASGKTHALIEECITGMELTVGVIGNEKVRALPPSHAVASAGVLSIEEKFLPGAGENQTPAPLSQSAIAFVQRTMEAAYRAIGCKGYARIDCFYQSAEQSTTGKERVVFIEFNTLPGLTPATCIFHQASEVGIKPMDFIDMIIELGFEEHKNISATTISHFINQEMVTPTII